MNDHEFIAQKQQKKDHIFGKKQHIFGKLAQKVFQNRVYLCSKKSCIPKPSFIPKLSIP